MSVSKEIRPGRNRDLFRFKEFCVNQAGCAMRINTDGVLLGALAASKGAGRILDVGTGTGVIAMMLAQRNPDASVAGVEVDAEAASRAAQNFQSSPFSDRMSLYASDFFDLSVEPFDMIVSNPPFFTGDLINPDPRKGLARHAEAAFFNRFFTHSASHLNEGGNVWIIVPASQHTMIEVAAKDEGFHIWQQIRIRSDLSKPVIRHIYQFGKASGEQVDSEFEIYDSPGQYTIFCRQLLAPFLLSL